VFTGLYFCKPGEDYSGVAERLCALAQGRIPFNLVVVAPQATDITAVPSADETTIQDIDGLLVQRFDAKPGSLYLLRPDQHLCSRWRAWTERDVIAALNRATCNG
jgi:3-(3-hydroxy-phenyl)propionate hydroxylase